MIEVKPTLDMEYIFSLIKNEEIYPFIKDDSCPDDPSYLDAIPFLNKCLCLKVLMDSNPVGAFIFQMRDHVFEVHTILTKACRGMNALKAARSAIKWIFSNTECKEITSYSFSDSPHVGWFARSVGMREISRDHHPFTRSGESVDIINYSLLKTS